MLFNYYSVLKLKFLCNIYPLVIKLLIINLLISATIEYSSSKIGEIDPSTDDYDGMIGFIQRNETNSMLQFVRTDSTPNEPGHFITFYGFYDAPKIYSYQTNRESFQITDILTFSIVTIQIFGYIYFIASFYVLLFFTP